MPYSYDRRASSKLTIGPGRIDPRATDSLKRVTLKAKNDGTLNGAVVSAGFYARKTKKLMFVYEGNSFMHKVFRVTDKGPEYTSPINNTGDRMLSITPELEVSWHDVKRPE